MISLGILTIGLLGVAALFPVGSFYLQKGEVADYGSALAQAAFHDVVARGMLDPQQWLTYEYRSSVPSPNGWTRRAFLKRFVDQMQARVAWAMRNGSTSSPPVAQGVGEVPVNAAGQQELNREFGAVYVIDPLSASSKAGVLQQEGWSVFPYVNQSGWNMVNGYLTHPQWVPWRMNSPLLRVTLLSPHPTAAGPYWSMSRAVTDRVFYANDDLAIDLPSSEDRPAVQRWEVADVSGTLMPLARQSKGNYSWIVTVAAPHVMARNALGSPATNSHNYQVSVVVFYKRPVDAIVDPIDATPNEDYSQGELWSYASIKSTGLSGGEVLLTAYPGLVERPFDALKSGEWLMLCGPHPDSTDLRPAFVANWYRVIAISKDVDPADVPPGAPREQRYVALRGPRWPWTPKPSYGNDVSRNLCAIICPGAVAVHSKTMRLEGQGAWSIE